jgi:hypothetical protein
MYAAPTNTNATPDFFKIFKCYSLSVLLVHYLQDQTILIKSTHRFLRSTS